MLCDDGARGAGGFGGFASARGGSGGGFGMRGAVCCGGSAGGFEEPVSLAIARMPGSLGGVAGGGRTRWLRRSGGTMLEALPAAGGMLVNT